MHALQKSSISYLPEFVHHSFIYLLRTGNFRVIEFSLIFLGVNEEGIFRISGSLDQILKWKNRVDEGKVDFFVENVDCHIVAGLLRLYFRELPEVMKLPVFQYLKKAIIHFRTL
jgi:hypothetical protein